MSFRFLPKGKRYPKIHLFKKDSFFTFMRAQFSSQISSATDFLTTILLAKLFDMYYVVATTLGALAGGAVNCSVNYFWAFKAKDCKKKYVLIKYVLVWIGSIGLNTLGVYLLTESIQDTRWIQEALGSFAEDVFILSKIVVSLLVGWLWNYNLHRIFVFRDCNIKNSTLLKIIKKRRNKSLVQTDNI